MGHQPHSGPVLAATDLSTGGAEALRQAEAVANDLGERLVVCHALPELFRVRLLFPQDAGPDVGFQDELRDKARSAVVAHVEEVLGRPLADISIAVDTGSVHSCILSEADTLGAGLVAVGAGATALRVARHAQCPVLVARQSPARGTVLGATDFSDPSLPAVEAAAAEAKRRGVPLTLIHCIDIPASAMAVDISTGALPLLTNDSVHTLEVTAHERLVESLKRFEVDGVCLVSRGLAPAGIVTAAEELSAGLVVVGTRGRSGLPRLALGSVAESVIEHSPCSVLVVHLGASQHERRRAA